MRVLFLHRYGPQAASFRYRFEQYFSYFQSRGVEVAVQSFFSDRYLQKKYSGQGFLVFEILKSYWQRILFFLKARREFDVIVLYKDALPYLPFAFEYWLILGRRPYLVDIDDALYLNYQKSGNPFLSLGLGRKFEQIFKNANHILGGNSTLAGYAKKYNSNVSVLPTVVDMNYYSRSKDFSGAAERPLVFGWMGSPSTAVSLEMVKGALKRIAEKYPVKVKIVGGGNLDLGLRNCESLNWSHSREIDDLLSFDVGIMPLEDHEWNRGKCGFKLIQYMACGMPVIGSPVGVNSEIIDHGENGYLATTEDEWVKALEFFCENRHLLADFGAKARRKVRAKYSLESAAPRFLEVLQQVDHVKELAV